MIEQKKHKRKKRKKGGRKCWGGARLQNEIAPEIVQSNARNAPNNARKDPKKEPKRLQMILSPSRVVLKYFTGTSLKMYHHPKLEEAKRPPPPRQDSASGLY